MLARTHSSHPVKKKCVHHRTTPPPPLSHRQTLASLFLLQLRHPPKKSRPLAAVSFHHLCPLAPVCFYLFLTLVHRSMLKSNAASLCNVDATKGQPCASISFSSGANVEGPVKAARCCVKHQRAASLKGINRFLAARWANPACL